MFETIASAITASVIVNGVIIFLLKEWVTSRLKSSIDAEYKKQHEVFSRELDRKNKIEIVSDILAEWIRNPPNEKMTDQHRTTLNKLSFKSTLWLPPNLSKELANSLQLKENSKSIFEILIMARKELIDDEQLGPEHVTYWGNDNKSEDNDEKNS